MIVAPPFSASVPMVIRADNVPGQVQGHWTYADYAALPEDNQRYEIINGVLYIMPSPNTDHQGANIRFAHFLLVHLEFKGLGRVFTAPYDVVLSPDNTVQPDLVVVLNDNPAIIGEKNIEGAPDLVVEISSPGTAGYDRREKQDTYARAGIKEYWIADPNAKSIEILKLIKNQYVSAGVFQGKDKLLSKIVPRLRVLAEQFFA